MKTKQEARQEYNQMRKDLYPCDRCTFGNA